MKKIVLAIILITMASSAMAWGDKEQGVLIGIGSAILFDKWREHNEYGRYGNTSYYPRYDQRFPPFRCSSRDRVECAYQKGEYDRDRQQWEAERRRVLIEQRDNERRAYECGRTGNCE